LNEGQGEEELNSFHSPSDCSRAGVRKTTGRERSRVLALQKSGQQESHTRPRWRGNSQDQPLLQVTVKYPPSSCSRLLYKFPDFGPLGRRQNAEKARCMDHEISIEKGQCSRSGAITNTCLKARTNGPSMYGSGTEWRK